jgi:peptidyl-prolyl cis-trans isomerase SurA
MPHVKSRQFVFLLAALLAVSATAPQAAPARTVTLDRIVAIVNDEVITQRELDDQKRNVVAQLQRQGTPLPPTDVLDKQVLERSINERAQLQFAKDGGIRIDDATVDKAIARIAEENKLSLADFRKLVEKDGIPYAKFREEIRNEIVINRVREREVDSRIMITEAEIDNYLATQQTQGGKEDEYRLAHILVLVPEQASSDQIQAKQARAEEAYRQLKAGADFGQIAAGFSDAADAMQGGDLGWRPAGRLPTVFAEKVRAMNVGEVSPVSKSSTGFHIVKLVDKRSHDTPTVIEQTHARHILVKVNEIVSENDAKAKIERMKSRIDGGVDFAEVAKLNSEDGSASRGGDLGWLSPGDTVLEFERALNALAPNQVSEPVRSPFGWHLIEVLERRKQDVTIEKNRTGARLAILARKSDEAYQDWVRQLRDRAYVEYRLDER